MSKIDKYLPEKIKLQTIQVVISAQVRIDAEKIKSKKGLKWNELIEALLKRYIDEA